MTDPCSRAPNSQDMAERVARESYGKLVAILAKRDGDIAAAEDALADAFSKALVLWPEKGVPASPEAWLLTVAKNKQTDRMRSAEHRLARSLGEDEDMIPDAKIASPESGAPDFPDERLKLMFVCAHPAIDKSVHTPLMMQTVLGFEAGEIAQAYLQQPATLSQRLVRAKRKIKDARIPFVIPDELEIGGRIEPVMEAVYGVMSLLPTVPASNGLDNDMAAEALYLAGLLADRMPSNAEALGLVSLICLSLSRRPARLDAKGHFVPLHLQDVDRWDAHLVRRGIRALNDAARLRAPGRFQIEAAIQAAHAERLESGETNWYAIVQLYDALLSYGRSMGAVCAMASALLHAHGPEPALHLLTTLEDETDPRLVGSFHPFWAVRAAAFKANQDFSQARIAFDKAISLATETPVRLWLTQELADCNN
ncbi:MAG: DUF6596 domain-containing protein [Pseudomonadota bacterium]